MAEILSKYLSFAGLQSPVVRRAIAEIIDVVRSNDELVMRRLKEMIG